MAEAWQSEKRATERSGLLPLLLVCAVMFALYSATLFFEFQWDDIQYVVANPLLRGLSFSALRSIWTTPYLGHYAPLHITLLSFIANTFGVEPIYFHIAQLLLHGFCILLLFVLLKKLCGPRVALLVALLFAVHPTNIETVAWIAETKSTLAFLFFLLSFLALLRLEEWSSGGGAALVVVLLGLSLLAKISTVVAPGIFVLHCWRRGSLRQPRMAATLLATFLLSATFALIHLTSFFHSATTFAKSSLEGSYVGGLGTHLMNLPFLIFFYLKMLVYPSPLTAWHMAEVRMAFNAEVAVAWLVLLLAVAALLWKANREVLFWVGWFVAFLLPVLQIIPNLTWVAERYLYMPAIGIFVLFAQALWRLPERMAAPRGRWLAAALAAACVGPQALLTWRHVPVFRSGLTLWQAALPTCGASAQCHAGYGEELLGIGKTEAGMHELIAAVNIRPSAVYLEKLGDGYTLSAGDFRQAAVAYRMALEQSPDNLTLRMKSLRTLVQGGDLEQAAGELRAVQAEAAGSPLTLLAESMLHWKQGNLPEARSAYDRVLSALGDPTPSPRVLIGLWGNGAEVGRLLRALRSDGAG